MVIGIAAALVVGAGVNTIGGNNYFLRRDESKEGIVLEYLGTSLLTATTLYIWTIFAGMFTGSSIAQIIFTYILNLLASYSSSFIKSSI